MFPINIILLLWDNYFAVGINRVQNRHSIFDFDAVIWKDYANLIKKHLCQLINLANIVRASKVNFGSRKLWDVSLWFIIMDR